MNTKEIKALVTLLDDEDMEVVGIIETEIKRRGNDIIPFLENEWEESSMNPIIQRKIEELIHSLQFEQVLERLSTWFNGGSIDLLEGLWIISTYQYPELSYSKLNADIEQIYYEAWLEFKADMHPVDQIKVLNHVFFNTLKFAPNTKSFHSANNSMIQTVLESRRGNPISLCCLYMLVAQRLGMPVYGVNLPNLFVLTYKKDATQFYINVFNKGVVFVKSDIEHFIGQLNLRPIDTFFEPCSNLDIVRRMLRNLGIAFEKVGDTEKVTEVEKMVKILLEIPSEDSFF